MDKIINELTEKCWMINNAFKMDVEVIDEQIKTILHISEDTEPLIMTETRKEIYAQFLKTLMKVKKHSFGFQTDSFLLSYIAIPIIVDNLYKGVVIAGPFLNERVSDHFIWNVMKVNSLENIWFKPLEDYFRTIPYVGESYLALGDILVNIFGNPRLKSQIITIESSREDKPKQLQPQEFDQDDFDIKLRYKH